MRRLTRRQRSIGAAHEPLHVPPRSRCMLCRPSRRCTRRQRCSGASGACGKPRCPRESRRRCSCFYGVVAVVDPDSTRRQRTAGRGDAHTRRAAPCGTPVHCEGGCGYRCSRARALSPSVASPCCAHICALGIQSRCRHCCPPGAGQARSKGVATRLRRARRQRRWR
jgi:hypothetical protein